MKRAYKKPMVALENFTLSERVAACEAAKVFDTLNGGCQNNTDSTLSTIIASLGIFRDASCGFPVEVGDTIPVDGVSYCYHTSSNAVFSS